MSGLALALLLAANSRGQGPSNAPSSLARYVPKDNLVFYVEYEGLEAHADAWRKTAAYKILNDTPTGAMLETLAGQFLGKWPDSGLSGAEAVDLITHVARSGFLFAVVGDPEAAARAPLVFVLKDGFKDKAIRPIVAKTLQNLGVRNVKHQAVIRAGHKVMTGSTTQGRPFTWWVEDSKKADVVLVLNPPEQADVILETLDGKRPSAIGHPRRIDLATPKDGFHPNGMAFLDLEAIKSPESRKFREGARFQSFEKDYGYLGIFNFKSVDIRWGFQDESLMSVARIATSGPRKGLLALLDRSSIDKTKLPPIPPSVGGFTAASFDVAGTLDRLRAQLKAWDPKADEVVDRLVAVVKEKTKLRLQEDILSHLGPRVAWYVLPAKASTTPAGLGSSMIGMMMAGAGVDQVPRLAIVLDVDDPSAFGKVLDELMAAANREFKARAARALGDAPQPKSGRPRGPGVPSVEFRLMSGESKMYVLQVPPELAGQFPTSLRPSIRVGPKQVVLAVSPEVARLALEVKGGWSPPNDLGKAFRGLPEKLKMIEVGDPRETLPGILAALPGKLQQGINSAIMFKAGGPSPPAVPTPGGPGVPMAGRPGGAADSAYPSAGQLAARPAPGGPGGPFPGAPGGSGGSRPPGGAGMPGMPVAPGSANLPGGAAPFTFQIDASKLPSANSIKALLFPSIFAVEATVDEIRITTREAFPTLPDPSKLGMISTLVPLLGAKVGLPLGGSPTPGGVPTSGGPPPPGAGPGPARPGPGGGAGLRPD